MKNVFVIATNNPGKLREISDILGGLGARAVSQKEAGISVSPEETGETFTENALIKARAACKASGLPAIADDSGLCVDALGGAPGVYSARFCEKDHALFLLSKMKGEKNRRAHFECAAACVFPDGEELVAVGRCDGLITEEARGTGGFGYDPVFLDEASGKTFAELSEEKKNGISHRGRALNELARLLKEKRYADR